MLAVDDDPDSGGIVQRILQRSGAEVHLATSMDAAIAEFSRSAPNVVVSDIGMPGHDGTNSSRDCVRCPVAALSPLSPLPL